MPAVRGEGWFILSPRWGWGRWWWFEDRGLTPPAKKLAAPTGLGRKSRSEAGGRRIHGMTGERIRCITGNQASDSLTDVRGWEKKIK